MEIGRCFRVTFIRVGAVLMIIYRMSRKKPGSVQVAFYNVVAGRAEASGESQFCGRFSLKDRLGGNGNCQSKEESS